MKVLNKTINFTVKVLTLASIITVTTFAHGADNISIVDDFNLASETNSGFPRMSINDTSSGGNSSETLTVNKGIMHITGDIEPARGQPGWSSLVLPLSKMGESLDVSKFTGIQLLVKVSEGSISVSANSAEITNYDYHAAPVIVHADGNFHQVNIPFDSMKRAWSTQTNLNTQVLNSLSIVAFGLKKGSFDYSIDEISFYK